MSYDEVSKDTPPRSNYRKQCGQVLVLYALLIPLFFLFAGVGLDLGWYYLNVSRLQNAADASVLVGAKSLLDELQNDSANKTKYAGYRVALVDKYPSDNLCEDIDITSSAVEAKKYAIKNLSSDNVGYTPQFFSVAEAAEKVTEFTSTLNDNWSKGGDPTITMNAKLYQDGDALYYVVTLEEDIQHFFMPGWFEEMNAPVVAVAKLSKDISSRKIVFNANGGHLVKGSDKTVEVTIYADDLLEEVNSFYAAVTTGTPAGYSDTPERDGYEFFRYWTDKREGGKIIPYASKLTKDNIDEFFATYDTDNDGTIIMYAQWRKLSSTPVELKFDANGGKFYNGDKTDSKNIKKASAMDDDETTDPITPNKGLPEREGYEFKGWSTDSKADANSLLNNYIPDGKQLTKTEMENLYGDKTSVTLYAVWKKIESTTTPPEEVKKPHNNKTLWEQMQYLIAKNVYNYYWYSSTNKYGVEPYNNSFKNPKAYTEEVTSGKGRNKTTTTYYRYWTEKIDLTDTENSNRKISESDHYYIDFFQTGDGRLGLSSDNQQRYGVNNRIHALFNVNVTFPVRSGKNDDPLYCRIESEPYKSEPTPIRQIVININTSNLAADKRPLFFFYDGPDGRTSMSTVNPGLGTLEPQYAKPVILNLNADFKGALFMPDVPVVINGNGHTFEGFIVAKEFYYLSSSGTQVFYSSAGQTDKTYSDNKIKVNLSGGDVNITKASGNTALTLYANNATDSNKFNLSANSKFRKFTVDKNVNYMYVFYGYDDAVTMDESPFHEYADLTKDLMPLYKLDEYGNQERIMKWEDVKLYDTPRFDENKKEIPGSRDDSHLIPKNYAGDSSKKGTVRLTNGVPSPLYDEAGNPVYFCDSYMELTGTYTVLTLDRVDDGTRKSTEFLLTADTANISASTNVSNTDDWK